MTTHYEIKVEYLYNNTYKEEFDKDGNPKKQGLDLLIEGFLFKKHRYNKNSINWLCKHEECKGSITVDNVTGKVIRYVKHDIDNDLIEDEKLKHKALSQGDIDVMMFKQKCKIRAGNEDVSTNQIYHEELETLSVDSSASNEMLASSQYMRSFDRLKSALQKRKAFLRPKLPTSLKDVSLSGEYLLTTKQTTFLIYNKNNKLLVFASYISIDVFVKYVSGIFDLNTNSNKNKFKKKSEDEKTDDDSDSEHESEADSDDSAND